MTLHPQAAMYLSAIRQAAGINQGKLAHHIGTKQAAISHYENGVRRLPEKAAEQIASALGVDPRILHTNEPLIPEVPQTVKVEGHTYQVMLKHID